MDAGTFVRRWKAKQSAQQDDGDHQADKAGSLGTEDYTALRKEGQGELAKWPVFPPKLELLP